MVGDITRDSRGRYRQRHQRRSAWRRRSGWRSSPGRRPSHYARVERHSRHLRRMRDWGRGRNDSGCIARAACFTPSVLSMAMANMASRRILPVVIDAASNWPRSMGSGQSAFRPSARDVRLSGGRSSRHRARYTIAQHLQNPQCGVREVLLVLYEQGFYEVHARIAASRFSADQVTVNP